MNVSAPKQFSTSFVLRLAMVCMLGVALSGCTWNKDRSGKVGGAMGGIGGGILGSKGGTGSGKTALIILGATLGAMWGEDIARGMTDIDKIFAERTTKDTLEYGKPGDQVSWSNPDSGNSGKVKAEETFKNDQGEDCRKFESSSVVNGEERTTTGTACRMADGEWKITEEPA
jgi:surface antigen